MNSDELKDINDEDESFMRQLKVEGVSAEEAGYRSTERIYGGGKADPLDLALLRMICEQGLAVDPHEGYLIGTVRWLDEQQAKADNKH